MVDTERGQSVIEEFVNLIYIACSYLDRDWGRLGGALHTLP
jgi:hypothetical protein